MVVKQSSAFYIAPFKRRSGQLQECELLQFDDEGGAFRRGKAMMPRFDGMVFFKIECSEDGDVWSRVETLATVGDVPPEAEEAA